MWQYVLLIISAVLFFGFVLLNTVKFGLLDCYSAYGEKWQRQPHELNWWTVVTVLSALLMIPVLLQNSEGQPWQAIGFLAPISLVLVGNTPNYKENKTAWWLHQIGAWGAVALIVAYILLIPGALWITCVTMAVALAITCIFGWQYITLFLELGMYAAIYAVLFSVI